MTSVATEFNQLTESSGQIKINFPSMPEEIILARQSEFFVNSFQTLPDGFHIFKQTNPLEIPLSFELHSMDREYANQGPRTLLQIAAKLHAVLLPIIRSRASLIKAAAPDNAGTGDDSVRQRSQTPSDTSGDWQSGAQDIFYGPVPCILDLISSVDDGPGIRCVGYVKSVSVSLRGPWLTSYGSAGGGMYRNLPTSAKYDFVFVHAPSYTNVLNNQFGNQVSLVQAGSADVLQNFYNTLALSNTVESAVADYRLSAQNQGLVTRSSG